MLDVITEMRRDTLMRAVVLIEDAGAELAQTSYALTFSGRQADRIISIDEDEAHRRSALGNTWIARSAKLDRDLLPPAVALTVDIIVATAERLAKEGPWFWHVYDPSGYGFFNMFGPTGYGEAGRWEQNVALLRRHNFHSGGDAQRYLGLLEDVAQLVLDMETRLQGQADRGILMPAQQVAQTLPLLAAIRARLSQDFLPDAQRYAAISWPSRFANAAAAIVTEIDEAFGSLGSWLESRQVGAPQTVGLSQYPGGRDVYEGLVRLHTTMDLTPQQAHDKGHERLAAIEDAMRGIARDSGFDGTLLEYRDALSCDSACLAADAGAVQAAFNQAVARAEPWMERWFYQTTGDPYSAEPLADELTAAVTFGYYRPPAAPGQTGTYFFNAPNLVRQGTAMVATLTYHELIPGHHVHLGGQPHNPALPKALRFNAFNAFAEGWAEYAAALSGEAGLFATPQEKAGRLMMDAFLTTRLVVDTGMNALGWSLERAREFMREHAFMSETEVRTESIRYSCDMPGQSLAYKLGDTYLLEQREKMRTALGDGFDIRDFHHVLLRDGVMPLPMAGREVDRAIAAAA